MKLNTQNKRINQLAFLFFVASAACNSGDHEGGSTALQENGASSDSSRVYEAKIQVMPAINKHFRSDVSSREMKQMGPIGKPRCLKVAYENSSPNELLAQILSSMQATEDSESISEGPTTVQTDSPLETEADENPFFFFRADGQTTVTVLFGTLNGRTSPSQYPGEVQNSRYLVKHEDPDSGETEYCWMRRVFLHIPQLNDAAQTSRDNAFKQTYPHSGTIRFAGERGSNLTHSYLKLSPTPSSQLLSTNQEGLDQATRERPEGDLSMARTPNHDPEKACLVGLGATIAFESLGEERDGHVLVRLRGWGLSNDSGMGGQLYQTPAFTDHWNAVQDLYEVARGQTATAPRCIIQGEAWVFKAHFIDWPSP